MEMETQHNKQLRKDEFINDKTTRIEKLLYDINELENDKLQIELFVQEIKKLPVKNYILNEQTNKFLTTLATEINVLTDVIDEFKQSISFIEGY